jgi:hypothetical protein
MLKAGLHIHLLLIHATFYICMVSDADLYRKACQAAKPIPATLKEGTVSLNSPALWPYAS